MIWYLYGTEPIFEFRYQYRTVPVLFNDLVGIVLTTIQEKTPKDRAQSNFKKATGISFYNWIMNKKNTADFIKSWKFSPKK